MSYAWWEIHCTPEETQETLARIREAASPAPSYFVVLILSTLIAAYGLISNSTATVIGAMIVAPLMGPILGLALAVVRKDTETFYTSLFAEVAGVALVIGTGMLVAFLVSPYTLDFELSEITARVRPTLYDLAIGFAAGLAGAYCTVHPKLLGSVAGVAIAVALVPPLAVTGLTTAGALTNQVGWDKPFGSFILFFANFLTIELAAIIVFLLAGMGQLDAVISRQGVGRSLIIKLLLLAGTGWFLTDQLHGLVQERTITQQSQRVIRDYVGPIEGARLEGLTVTLRRNGTSVDAVVSSREEIRPAQVAELERDLNEAVNIDYRPIVLSVRSIRSSLASATEFLDEPPLPEPDPEKLRREALDRVLSQALSAQPVELESFQNLPEAGGHRKVLLTVIGPYALSPQLVKELQQQVNQLAASEPRLKGPPFQLTVRSLVIRTANAEQDVLYSAPDTRTPEEKRRLEFEATVAERVRTMVEQEGGLRLLEVHVSRQQAEQQPREIVRTVVQTPKLLSYNQVREWERCLKEMFSDQESAPEFELEIEQHLGATIRRSALEEQLRRDQRLERVYDVLTQSVQSSPGARLVGQPELRVSSDSLEVRVVIASPKTLSLASVKKWEQALQKAESQAMETPTAVRLIIDNRLGQLVEGPGASPMPSPSPTPSATPTPEPVLE